MEVIGTTMTFMAWLIGVLLLNLILGVSLVLGVFTFMEKRVALGATGGIAVGTAIIYAQATLGEQMLTVTVSEMKLLVIAAALGGVVGVVGTVLIVKPDI